MKKVMILYFSGAGSTKKIARDCKIFLSILEKEEPESKGYIPRLRFSSIINAPNKFAGQLITFPIYLHQNKCINCGHCIRHCPHRAISEDRKGWPVFKKALCENCYRCIHHCPVKALSLSKKRTPKKVLKF